MSISESDFKYVSDLAYKMSAIVLKPGKEYLVTSRLKSVAADHDCDSLESLIALMRVKSSIEAVHAAAIDALTTNETLFFRDIKPFESLRKEVLPALIKSNADTKSIRIWSAACSTGQEPYSLAMLIKENFPQLASWRVSITATDLSETVLKKAKSASYNQIEVNRGLPAPLLFKYFKQENSLWIIKEEIRKMVEFKKLNLIENWPLTPSFDIIMIRNVLIYFDLETKRSILNKIKDRIKKTGTLILGSSESTVSIDQSWTPVKLADSIIYQPGFSS